MLLLDQKQAAGMQPVAALHAARTDIAIDRIAAIRQPSVDMPSVLAPVQRSYRTLAKPHPQSTMHCAGCTASYMCNTASYKCANDACANMQPPYLIHPSHASTAMMGAMVVHLYTTVHCYNRVKYNMQVQVQQDIIHAPGTALFPPKHPSPAAPVDTPTAVN